MEIPIDLREALDSQLENLSPKSLKALSGELSRRYREEQPSEGKSFLQSQEDAAAYAAFRMPATFAAVYSALSQAKDRLPNWSPRIMLDAGAGPGTAMWAATAVWPDIEQITLLEREEGMIKLGKKLSALASFSSIQKAEWIKTDIMGNWEASAHDLVTASYVLGELPIDYRDKFIEKLWNTAKDVLLIIEPGTPAGFLRIKQAREQLLTLDANTIAPCPHNKLCPMEESDWCHFSERVPRSRLHRQVKSAELSYEDEKFSFLCMSRLKSEPVCGRVIRHPQVRKGHICFNICAPEGIVSSVVTRKDKEAFKKARDLSWGSAMPSFNEKNKEP